MARNAGFMLTKKAADLRKRFFLGVVEAEALFFLRLETIERSLQGASEERNVAFAIRIGELDRRPKRPPSVTPPVLFTKVPPGPARQDRNQPPLGQNGPEHRTRRTAAPQSRG